MLTAMQDCEFDEAFALMEKSFPRSEYRPYPEQKALLQHDAYRIHTVHREEKLIGLAAIWQLDGFTFLEHLAVNPQNRNGGIGSAILRELCAKCTLPLFLEVELPNSKTSKRRIGFYRRNGFFLNPYAYCQPALSADDAPIPMYIMTAPTPIDAVQFESMRREVYRTVYRTACPS